MKRIALVAAVLALVLASGADAQRRVRPVSIVQARRAFAVYEEAYRELTALTVQPADANGAVRAWDDRWSRRLDALDLPRTRTCGDPTASCTDHERYVLVCGTRGRVLSARRGIFNTELDAPLVDPMAWRRAVADEDARRRAAGLSCEDLPAADWEYHQAADGGFETHHGVMVPAAGS